MRLNARILFLAIALTAAGAAVAQTAAPAEPAKPAEMVHKKTLIDLIRSGGWAMWPLGACSFAMVAMAALNGQRIRRSKLIPPNVVAQMEAAARGQDLQKILDLGSANDSFFTRGLMAGLRHLNPDDPMASKPNVETAIGETISREESRYGFYVNFLALLTSMSPMWGLLGTVSGMIGAFSKIGAGGMGKPEMLAANIGEALVCTATGLLVAIFSMFFYFLYRNLLNAIVKEAEGHFSAILDGLTGVGSAFVTEEPAAPPAPPAK